MKFKTSRRNFLKQGALASAALSLTDLGPLASSPKSLGRAATPRKVIVIGAGLAGLSAAFELTQAGHDVTVLEARTRPGGRVHTLREPFSGGLYAEAGAIRIDDHHNFTLKYVKLFDLPTVPPTRSPADAAITYYLRNTQVKLKAGEKPVWPLNLSEEEKKAGLGGLWRKYLLEPMKEAGGDATAWPPATLLKYDNQSFTEFMRQRGASADAAELLSLGLFEVWGNGLDSVSAPLLLREAALVLKTRQTFTIKGGNDLLPKAFASRLEEKIRYGVPVVRIEHDPQRVRVHFMQAGARQTLEADHLVCAIPFSVLKGVEMAPRLSAEKQKVVEQLPYTSVSRVYLQSRKKFWLDAGVAGGSLTDLPIMEVIESDGGETGPRSILESYTVGERSRRIGAMRESERIRFTLDQMEKVHPGMRANFEGGTSKCWDEDEWSRGAYIWYKPGQMSSLLPAVSKPEGRIHFAGEHTSSWPATMQGALESGNRAAQEINEAP